MANNGNRTPLYIGFGFLLLGFFILLNSYWGLKSEVAIDQHLIKMLQEEIDKQSKPCQAEDLLHPELSEGCTIQSKEDSSNTGSTPPRSNATTPMPGPTGPPGPQGTQGPPGPEPPEDPEPVCIPVIGVCL